MKKIPIKGGYIDNEDIKSAFNGKTPVCYDYDGNEYQLREEIIYSHTHGYFMTKRDYNKYLAKNGYTGRV